MKSNYKQTSSLNYRPNINGFYTGGFYKICITLPTESFVLSFEENNIIITKKSICILDRLS